MRPIRRAILHHSAGPDDATVESVRRYHREVRVYADIGYHWIIGRDGSMLPGRPETEIGAHTVGRNSGTIGICLIGVVIGGDDPTFPAEVLSRSEAQDRFGSEWVIRCEERATEGLQ